MKSELEPFVQLRKKQLKVKRYSSSHQAHIMNDPVARRECNYGLANMPGGEELTGGYGSLDSRSVGSDHDDGDCSSADVGDYISGADDTILEDCNDTSSKDDGTGAPAQHVLRDPSAPLTVMQLRRLYHQRQKLRKKRQRAWKRQMQLQKDKEAINSMAVVNLPNLTTAAPLRSDSNPATVAEEEARRSAAERMVASVVHRAVDTGEEEVDIVKAARRGLEELMKSRDSFEYRMLNLEDVTRIRVTFSECYIIRSLSHPSSQSYIAARKIVMRCIPS
jgi:hypothetical protein